MGRWDVLVFYLTNEGLYDRVLSVPKLNLYNPLNEFKGGGQTISRVRVLDVGPTSDLIAWAPN